jgi:hypothetical protein
VLKGLIFLTCVSFESDSTISNWFLSTLYCVFGTETKCVGSNKKASSFYFLQVRPLVYQNTIFHCNDDSTDCVQE